MFAAPSVCNGKNNDNNRILRILLILLLQGLRWLGRAQIESTIER